jgi:hypothetical protein
VDGGAKRGGCSRLKELARFNVKEWAYWRFDVESENSLEK